LVILDVLEFLPISFDNVPNLKSLLTMAHMLFHFAQVSRFTPTPYCAGLKAQRIADIGPPGSVLFIIFRTKWRSKHGTQCSSVFGFNHANNGMILPKTTYT